jgi:hypothetical protein
MLTVVAACFFVLYPEPDTPVVSKAYQPAECEQCRTDVLEYLNKDRRDYKPEFRKPLPARCVEIKRRVTLTGKLYQNGN